MRAFVRACVRAAQCGDLFADWATAMYTLFVVMTSDGHAPRSALPRPARVSAPLRALGWDGAVEGAAC